MHRDWLSPLPIAKEKHCQTDKQRRKKEREITENKERDRETEKRECNREIKHCVGAERLKRCKDRLVLEEREGGEMLRVKSEGRKWRNRMMDEQSEHGEIMLK